MGRFGWSGSVCVIMVGLSTGTCFTPGLGPVGCSSEVAKVMGLMVEGKMSVVCNCGDVDTCSCELAIVGVAFFLRTVSSAFASLYGPNLRQGISMEI